MFYQQILNIIKNKSYNEIIKDRFLIRHFLHNQTDDSLFSEVKEHLVPVIVLDKENEKNGWDWNNKRKLIEYLEKHWKQHTDETIQILSQINEKWRTANIKRRIAMAIDTLEVPKDPMVLFELAKKLLEETDPMVREFTERSLCKFVDTFSIEQNKELVNLMFFKKIEEKDIVQRTPSMSLQFQARDLANSSFREGARFLWLLLQNQRFSLDILPEFMRIYDSVIAQDLPEQDESRKIKYHFTWWLNDDDGLSHDRREYESDPKKRLSLELRNALNKIEKEDKPLFEKICNEIIEKAIYIWYFEILVRVLEDKQEHHPEVIKNMIMNPDVLMEVDTQKIRRHKFIHDYLSIHTGDIDEYIQKVNSIDISNNKKLEEYNKAWVFFAIPETNRLKEINKYIEVFEAEARKEHNLKERKMKVDEESDVQIHTSWEKQFQVDKERFTTQRDVESLVSKLVEYGNKWVLPMNDTDVYLQYGEYFRTHKDQLQLFYEKLSTEQSGLLSTRLPFYLVDWQIKTYQEEFVWNKDGFYEKIIELYELFENNSVAKLNIAKAIETNEYLRAKDTKDIEGRNPELFGKIIDLIKKICKDTDPEEDKDDSFSLMLNSVRGVGTILVSILAYYYPTNETLLQQIRDLSKNSLVWIQAAVIENLVYLIVNNYPFCQKIIEQFENVRVPIIDQSLIRYMFRLGNEKLQARLDLLDKISEDSDHDVREQLGKLIGQAYTHKVQMDDVIDKLISWKLWDVDTVNNFAFEIENEIPHILSFPDRRKMIDPVLLCYNKLLTNYVPEDPEHRWRIANRLSFLFYDEKLPEQEFDIFDTHKVFDTLIEHGEMTGQSNLNKYLLRCLKKNIDFGDRIESLLKKQTTKHEIILSDEYHGKSVADIVEYLLSQGKRSATVDEVFDEGLKYGSKYFYDIFDKYYKDKE